VILILCWMKFSRSISVWSQWRKLNARRMDSLTNQN